MLTVWQKLMNKIFGWDYAVVSHGSTLEVLRVIKSPSGKLHAKCYYGKLLILDSRRYYEPLTWDDIQTDKDIL